MPAVPSLLSVPLIGGSGAVLNRVGLLAEDMKQKTRR